MTDLIERLRVREAHEKTIPSFGHNAADRERAELIVLLREAATALEAAREPCVWTQGEECGQWHTECSNAFEIIDGTPADNSMVFCCYCGCPIAAIDAARKEVGDE